MALAITPATALADEYNDSLDGLTEEQLAQLDEQLGIMPLAQCAESGGSEVGAGGTRQSLVAVDMRVDRVETRPPTTTGGGKGSIVDNTLSGGLSGNIYCNGSRVAINQGSSGGTGSGRIAWQWTMSKNMWVYVKSAQWGYGSPLLINEENAWQVSKGDSCDVTLSYNSSASEKSAIVFNCGGKQVNTNGIPSPDGKGWYSMEINYATNDPRPDPEPGEPDPVYYTLRYNANGGSGTMSNQTAEEDTYITVKSNGFTRSGYTFQGWATSPSGSVTYDPGDSIYMSSDRTLYAVWQRDVNRYTLTYDKNASDATGSTASQTGDEGSSVAVRQNGFTRPGYQFTGWNTEPDGSGANYQPNASYTLNGNATLYAQWDPITVQVSYDPNGGTGSHEPTEGDANSSITIPSDLNDPFHRDHYQLTGWNTEPDGSGDAYAPGDSIHMGITDETLYAQWERIPVQVTYDPNGGDGSHNPTKGDAGEDITIPSDLNDPFTKPGSILIGWNTEQDGSGDSYQPSDNIPMGDEDKTLYAQWKELPSVLPSTGGDNSIPMPVIITVGVMTIMAVLGLLVSKRLHG